MIPWAVEFRYDDVLDERLDRTASRDAVMKMRARGLTSYSPNPSRELKSGSPTPGRW